jgi:prephenate dehydrogenase
MFDKVVIVGVGLIGGSFALGLKAAGAVGTVVGLERSGEALARALQLGIVDQAYATPEQALRGADLVLIAAPVAQTPAILESLLPWLEPHTIVTDAGSTKSDVVANARAVMKERIAQFVPGHPIAGRESNGPDAAIPDLYRGKKAVLTPLPENPQVSHLPHLLAYALVDDIANKAHADLLFQYAASGFRDFTRIAGSSPEMWRDISLANRDALLGELDAYLAQLQSLRARLAAADGPGLEAVYGNAQRARRAWIDAIEAAEKPPSQESGTE